ncbi:CDP-diacylglycerol--serine O-phosphatidyltransferase [Paenibacillus baekrokdamisoli]|uniref:CDP-diacylglycerol--serine O-phosphatidyltransferase n=1 Tax=Paenibacillus baekrokdamisoli TaxID=1712516 RepID=A0A3G9JLR0_9BACL|nr:CDP-diacylglycerol--serine O-phosphatidyltransferase [Paenibacillus baekrokdamisoli]MBB3073150.1 CDP-diacylglycerol--serine O-phosphatidyltransferase [Paenibacillus baekrokdamisoli]BBH23969.1 CDP-diacylglycerol--serine O-phosphatidyltransferase [Paenibacillus baekrokdamisoli]
MILKSIPSLFTVANLFLGIVAIILVFPENAKPEVAAMMVIIAMLMDGVDGRVARALNAQSEFGKELDSLSDVISFGVAPAFIMYSVAFQELTAAPAWIITALFPICGALRLARFNVVSGMPGYFIGLPIPAAGGVLATLALFHKDIAVPVLLVSTLVLAFLMVSTIKYPNFKKVGIPKNAIWVVPIIVVIAVILGILFPHHLSKIIFVPLVLYALYGLKKNVDRRLPGRKRKRRMKEAKLQEEAEHSA